METVQVHAIGKCTVKGCRSRKRNTVTGHVTRDRYGVRTSWGVDTRDGVMAAQSMWHCPQPTIKQLELYGDEPREWIAGMLNAGWICLKHRRVMKVVAVQGVLNETKECNGRCMGATGPSCECACGGELHGSTWD